MNAIHAPDAGRKEANFIVRDFRFQNGETLPELRLHYVTLGAPEHDSAGRVTNAVLLLHGTNGSGKTVLDHLGSELFGSGQPLDTAKYYLIIPDALGCGGSSKPSDGLRAKFPRYGYNDMVEAQKLLVTEGLGIDHLRLIVGLSMGAMHAWIWGGKYPDVMDALMPLVSLPVQISGHNLLWRRVITESIRNDPDYNGGDYVKQPSHWIFALPARHIMCESRVRIHEAAIRNEAQQSTTIQPSAKYCKVLQNASKRFKSRGVYGDVAGTVRANPVRASGDASSAVFSWPPAERPDVDRRRKPTDSPRRAARQWSPDFGRAIARSDLAANAALGSIGIRPDRADRPGR